ncbi:hypothetical protein PV325_008176, partial [Microctonus aethiopoides]
FFDNVTRVEREGIRLHSMLYFFHHYELPVILQQAHLQQILLRNHAPTAVQPPTPSTAPTTPGPTPASTPSDSPTPLTPTLEQTQQNYISELSQLEPDLNNDHHQSASSAINYSTANVNGDDGVVSTASTSLTDTSLNETQSMENNATALIDDKEDIKSYESSSKEPSTCEEFEVIETTNSTSKDSTATQSASPDV